MQKFWQEMRRALIQSTVMFVVAIAILKTVTGRFPWQITDSLTIESNSETVAASPEQTGHDYEF